MSPVRQVPLNVALVEAPFGPAIWPSIGSSLLKAELLRRGRRASVVYINHLLLGMMGSANKATLSSYQGISDAFGTHLGEWIFSDAAFPEQADPVRDAEYLALLAREGTAPELVATARRLKAEVETFLDQAIARVDWAAYDVVGFANTFSQLNASIALARRLRAQFPALPFIVGGAGCSDDMGVGVAEACSLFKAVALGEADEIIVELCEAVAAGDDERLARLPGVAFRDTNGQVRRSSPKARVTALDDLPIPHFDDYYVTLPAGYRAELPFYLPIEASRGCWWGAKHHCTFCGLNPDRMSHHAKTADRFLAEVDYLAQRYAPRRFMAVDNIMPRDFYETVTPRLRLSSRGAEFFFEVKANFREGELAAFARSGILQIQPGVESLSTQVLGLMKKGITGPANIATLRLCEEFGLRAHWSILYGFHGEMADDYRAITEICRRLFHLRPPLGVCRAEIERFAPMFRFPADNGLANLRPSHWYRYSYPVGDTVLAKLAYRFDADRIDRDPAIEGVIINELRRVITAWRESYGAGNCMLALESEGDGAIIRRATGAAHTRYHLSPRAYGVYRQFETPRPPGSIIPGLGDPWGSTPYLDAAFRADCIREGNRTGLIEIDSADSTELFSQLLWHGLVVQEGGRAVAVACRARALVGATDSEPIVP